MTAGGSSTLQSILENLRDFAIGFAKPYRDPDPEKIATNFAELLVKLGIANPTGIVPQALREFAANWGRLADTLSGVQFSATNPVAIVAEITSKAKTIEQSITAITQVPVAAWNAFSASGQAIADVFPRRLFDYIVYEAITTSHPKIGGVFLLFGVLRKDRVASANPAFIDGAMIRIFDVGQLIEVLTDPRRAVLKAFKWGTDDFNAQPFADGLALLVGLLPGVTRGPSDDVLPAADEQRLTGIAVAPGAPPSVRHTVMVPAGAGTTTLTFTGLHHLGFGLALDNPIALSGGAGTLSVPKPPAAFAVALTPGATPATDPPGVRFFP
ncbi:MAG: hypothetical protein NVS2B3_15900 [Vulcanimicrobiaceae bacterium]